MVTDKALNQATSKASKEEDLQFVTHITKLHEEEKQLEKT